MNIFFTFIQRLFIKDNKNKEIQNLNIQDLSLFYDLSNDDVFKEKNNQIILDLDLDDVFYKIDKTNSIIGKEYLYNHIVSQKTTTIDIEIIEKNIDYFNSNPTQKEATIKILKKANSIKLINLPYLFLKPAITLYPHINIYYLLSLSALASIIISIFNPSFILIFIFISIINFVIHYNNKKKLLIYSDSISQLETLYKVSKDIQNLNLNLISQESSKRSITLLSKMKYWLKVISSGNYVEINDFMLLFWYPFELLKACFLVEIVVMQKIFRTIAKQREDIRILYTFIGKIDLYLSISKLREDMLYFCKPTISTNKNKILICEDIIHPLIEDCVPNNITLNNQSLILTGSNMSGKTTFLRTIAINNILANTINTCFATKFESLKMQTLTSIRITDDLLQRKSFFFEEVSLLKKLINISTQEDNCLFVIDELFKGTNTRERIAASKSILEFLNKTNHIVLFSTHDLELIELLEEGFERGYFYEREQEGELKFDYKFKIGKNYLTNAIRILELNNYPQEIIDDAYDYLASEPQSHCKRDNEGV